MKPDTLQIAHLIYDLEKDYLQGLLDENPIYRKMRLKLKSLSEEFQYLDEPKQKQAYERLIDLLQDMTLEAGFKLGILFAHDYPLDEIISPHNPEDPDFPS